MKKFYEYNLNQKANKKPQIAFRCYCINYIKSKVLKSEGDLCVYSSQMMF